MLLLEGAVLRFDGLYETHGDNQQMFDYEWNCIHTGHPHVAERGHSFLGSDRRC